MKIQGVLFDMDGVILDTERATRDIFIELSARYGYTYPPDIYREVLGTNMRETNETHRRIFGDAFPAQALLEETTVRLAALAKAGALRYRKGFEECVAALRGSGVRMALATSTNRDLVEIYRTVYPVFRDAFDVTVCGMEVPQGKPKPDIYLLAARRLGLAPGACVGVEDSYYGLQSLRAAGAVSVMIPDLLPYTEAIAPQVDYHLTDLTQLCPLIRRLNAGQGE